MTAISAETSSAIKSAIWQIIRKQGEDIVKRDLLMYPIVQEAILNHATFMDALIYRLSTKLQGGILDKSFFISVFHACLEESQKHQEQDAENNASPSNNPTTWFDIERLAMEDLIAVEERDPACHSIAQVFLYFKGYKAIQIYRFMHVLWRSNRQDLALLLQARVTEVFGMDIHPGAQIEGGLMIDHGTGVVIGETTTVGKDCTFLHGITLGGTGNSTSFDRHPKIGNNVFIGCQSTVLGNISIGDCCKIGAGAMVLKPLPAASTAIGAPARIISINKACAERLQAKQERPDLSLSDDETAEKRSIDVTDDEDEASSNINYEIQAMNLIKLAEYGIKSTFEDGSVGTRLWRKVWKPKEWNPSQNPH